MIFLGAKARAEYTFAPLADGDAVTLGRVRLQALETPGHTIESISILVFDLDRDRTHPHPCSLLQQRNFQQYVELAGGMAAWEAAKLPRRGQQ